MSFRSIVPDRDRPSYASTDAIVYGGVTGFLVVLFGAAFIGAAEWRELISLVAAVTGAVMFVASALLARGVRVRPRVGAVAGARQVGLVICGRDRSRGYGGMGLLALFTAFTTRPGDLMSTPVGFVRLLLFAWGVLIAGRIVARALAIGSPLGIAHNGLAVDVPRYRALIPWERFDVAAGTFLTAPSTRLTFDPPVPLARRPGILASSFVSDRPLRDLRLERVIAGADPESVGKLLLHYQGHPEDRSELATERGLERLREIESRRWGEPWPPPPRTDRPTSTDEAGPE